ncbi:hypothetical protein SAMN05216344_102121 [Polaromonas sp. OV174]|uniref:hypothetical protein n=1 Tax=Polaromonas sp. OV174 TaxID=1855300 RepID=UPI0008F3FF01|nr:hypothetical protein [Polaromonas sp. OV174]SFB73502.1 hypothetical protein SAMN05216344_102121 [Polaromonas sp. OV174]
MPKIYGKKIVVRPVKSLWPHWIARVFESFREIPWLSLTAIGTFLGVVLLFLYFRSIEHFPSEFSVVVSLGVATLACAIGVLVFAALGFAGPAIIYREYVSGDRGVAAEPSKVFTDLTLTLLQLGGVGVLFSWILLSDYLNCKPSSLFFIILAPLLLITGGSSFVAVLCNKKDKKPLRARLGTAVSVGVFGLAPFLALSPLLPLFDLSWLSGFVILLGLWVLAIMANAAMATRLPALATAMIALFCMFIAYILLPLIFVQPSFFPALIATHVGVRGDHPQNLYVPNKTCELIGSAMKSAGATKVVSCASDDWNEVVAVVLSNVGERWLIEIGVEQKSIDSDLNRLRLTIPGKDVQIVNRKTAQSVRVNASRCSNRNK